MTIPLLLLNNQTKLISDRCRSTTLPPHLLAFLADDLESTPFEVENNPTEKSQSTAASPTTTEPQNEISTRPPRYLFALVTQDSGEVLPDTLTRIMETIGVLGSHQCHLSIVDHGSKDSTVAILDRFSKFLDSFNTNADSQEQNDDSMSKRDHDDTNGSSRHLRHHLTYSITMLDHRDDSSEGVARVKNMALTNVFANTLRGEDIKSEKSDYESARVLVGEENQDKSLEFDSIIMLEPSVLCPEDLLELVYQSRLQGADLTCGMDFGITKEDDKSRIIYKQAIVRDITSKSLPQEALIVTDEPNKPSDQTTPPQFSSDEETQNRFQKRLPFQVESCWSSAVVIKASSLINKKKPALQGSPLPSSTLQTRENLIHFRSAQPQCAKEDLRSLFCQDLWMANTPTTPAVADNMFLTQPSQKVDHPNAKFVLVPTVQFSSCQDTYAKLATFNAWGLWPKSEQAYRDEVERKLIESSHHSMYGYKPSTNRYGYAPRVKEETVQVELGSDTSSSTDSSDPTSEALPPSSGTASPESKENKGEETDQAVQRMMSIPESAAPALKSKLEEIKAIFGVQDIENEMQVKREADLITEWRVIHMEEGACK
ncbi:capsular associated protein [Lunasporangiospora selenospora]|uniref:Capsular associated protein n=1 Tax=Lunasporangiospora selenospora TaxID=979761 RepID=A0A9P6FSZ3_9FUNG|nr:capsular associated protein [Lunasporangiospora selenospora]